MNTSFFSRNLRTLFTAWSILALGLSLILPPQRVLLTPSKVEAATAPVTVKTTPAQAARAFGELPLYFVENRGQLDRRVSYYVKGSDKTIYFTAQGLTFVLNEKREDGPQSHSWTLKLDFVGARTGVRPEGQEQTGATFSYFKGQRSQWQAGLRSYSEIVYHDLWPGIDLVYAGTVNRMKYTFVVKPGADPDRIKLAWRGARGVNLNAAGELEVTTPAGGFTDERPISWQESNGQRVHVATGYELESKRKPRQSAVVYGFNVGKYDRSRELVIDPAMFVYCGFIGGSGIDGGSGIAVDSFGNAYVTGFTASSEASFPVRVGPDLTANGQNDAFVAKVNASGTALLYCGYIGGSSADNGVAIAVDSAGNAYVGGSTSSNETSFPVTVGPDLTFNGGSSDAFVAKLNASGTALIYCGYIGGDAFGSDIVLGIAVDNPGNAYVTGQTSSTEASFPVTIGPDLTFNGGFSDAFVAKVNANGTTLDYCGYIGGSGQDVGSDIVVDGAGNAYVGGSTSSNETSFPVTVGPDLTYNGNINDAFVAKLNADGTTLVYCGYIGGTGVDTGQGIAIDSAGNAYVSGFTGSSEASFPVTVGPDLTFNGNSDAYVAKVNAAGTALIYAGYIGGAGGDRSEGIAIDSIGNVYVTGQTDSTEATFPVISGPDLTFNGGPLDAFVAKVNRNGTALDYCGYLGGNDLDFGTDIAVDSVGNAYVTGQTFLFSPDSGFPATVGPDLTHNGGPIDAFVAKIALPEDQLAALIAQVEALIANGTLSQNQGDGLLDKLQQVIAKLGADQTGAACNQLNAFINQVNAFINSGALTPGHGQTLIDAVNALKANVGC